MLILTFAGFAVRSREEAHVALAAVAPRHVQAVAALAQVHILRTLVTICTNTRRRPLGYVSRGISSTGIKVWGRSSANLSSRSRLQRSPLCTHSGRSPWCSYSQHCGYTCEYRWNTRPDLKGTENIIFPYSNGTEIVKSGGSTKVKG